MYSCRQPQELEWVGKSKDASCALEDGSEENLPKEGSQHVTETTQEQGTPRAWGFRKDGALRERGGKSPW